MQPMYGHMPQAGLFGGFQIPNLPSSGIALRPSQPLFRFDDAPIPQEISDKMESIRRGEFGNESGLNIMLMDLIGDIQKFNRTITSTMTAFPVRENLEAPARILVPMDTPMRNRIPRVPGSGTAAAWRQLTSFGGGYGVNTTVTTGASSATQTLGSTAGLQPGDQIYFATSAAARIVSSVTNATVVVLTATISTTTAEVVTRYLYQPGTGTGAIRSFFAETGAPASHTSVYASKSASYKLLGTYYDVTGFAMAAGATYQNQYATEQRNAIWNLMLNEENAIVNGSSTITAAPWGDGTNALGYDGIRNLTTTANGVPTDQVQAAVGPLTFAHIDQQFARIWNQGGRGFWMLINQQEKLSINHLFDATGSTNRVVFQNAGDLTGGRNISAYVDPINGERVDLIVDRFMPPGEIVYGCDMLPDGSPALQMDVLPQVMLPELAPDQQIQGYTAQVLAPTTAAPQVYPGIVTAFEVLKMKGATVFAKDTGVTAV